MGLVFITGSTDGLGYATARALIQQGHKVVLHARSLERATAISDLALQSLGVVIGDLSSSADIYKLAKRTYCLLGRHSSAGTSE
jgi:NAD(P)-dependent dehydrogenase (short-subunit alcohol dehydrogenase family)